MSSLVLSSDTLAETPTTGAFEYDGKVGYFTPISNERGLLPSSQFLRLNTTILGLNAATTTQGVFTNGTSSASTISGTTLTVGGTVTGTFAVGQGVFGSGVTANTVITGLGTGTGGAGTYTVNTNQTVTSTNINSAYAVTLNNSTQYAFDALYVLSKTAGTTSHTISLVFGGTATANNVLYQTVNSATGNATFPLSDGTPGTYTINTLNSTAVTGAITTATYSRIFNIKGTVSINAGGTFIPQYVLSAAPGGGYSSVAGSYFSIYPIGASGSDITVGSWV